MEEPARNFLPRSYFGESTVFRGIKVDVKRFLVGAGFVSHWWFERPSGMIDNRYALIRTPRAPNMFRSPWAGVRRIALSLRRMRNLSAKLRSSADDGGRIAELGGAVP
jgi:hypothetical protein